MKTSLARLIAMATLVIGVMIATSSCGTQKLGCPGSITKTEQTAPAHS